jgi:DNA mismatch endonuclease, patch repair protein
MIRARTYRVSERGMADFLSKRERSALMSRIRGKNTGIEKAVFGLLRNKGVRFRRHAKRLPGCPDVVIPDVRLAIFLDGDFWHGRHYVKWRRTLAPFWRDKIETNIARDKARRGKLRRLGWRVMRIWGSDIRKRSDSCLERILRKVDSCEVVDREGTNNG